MKNTIGFISYPTKMFSVYRFLKASPITRNGKNVATEASGGLLGFTKLRNFRNTIASF